MTETVQHTAGCVEAWEARVEARRAYDEAWEAYGEAGRAYDEAWKACGEARKECGCDD
jgi:hypothetical protein